MQIVLIDFPHEIFNKEGSTNLLDSNKISESLNFNREEQKNLHSTLQELTIFMLNFSKFKESSKSLFVEVMFVNSKEMLDINKEYRNKECTTDVLSFPLDIDKKLLKHIKNTDERLCIGNIIINTDLSLEVSKKLGHDVFDEIKLLYIHALLHLFGFDHEIDRGEHRKKEREIIEFFKLPKSLIMRTEDE